ncbi:MAG TPA: hypothetical protein VEA36_02155 [Candidatus Paceibacterota bacterium]|nr:hypothetical protein [Candidatus Paceibacterota bacterium]
MEGNLDSTRKNEVHRSRSGESFAPEVDLNNPRLQIALAIRAFPDAPSPSAAFKLWMDKEEDGATLAQRFRGLRDTKGDDFPVNMANPEELDALIAETQQHPPHPTLH